MTYDRAAIMRDAHKRFRDGKRLGLGWTFGQCMSTAWAAAKDRHNAHARGFAHAALSPTSSLGGSLLQPPTRNAPTVAVTAGRFY